MPDKNSEPRITTQNPLGDPRNYRGMSTNLKKLSAAEKRSDFLPSFNASFGGFVIELLKIIIIALAIIVPIRTFILQPFYVKGASMEPNFHDNEYLIIDELSYRLHTPQRGDVVVIRNPMLGEFLIKRVIGLPGERVVINDGRVTIYNAQLPDGGMLNEQAYLPAERLTFGELDITLTSDQYYVLGDNRPASLDSRSFGPIARHDIIGRTALRAWPLYKAQTFRTPSITLLAPVTP
ncbi:MAG: signal peptidase I [Candidatus Kerfeldbacteria bacterium]|nr:signal peptidase I [Candidatus Kerfeldbacteria bacterium]